MTKDKLIDNIGNLVANMCITTSKIDTSGRNIDNHIVCRELQYQYRTLIYTLRKVIPEEVDI